MEDKNKVKPSSEHLKDALQVKVGSDKEGKPILLNKRYTRGSLWVRIKKKFKRIV